MVVGVEKKKRMIYHCKLFGRGKERQFRNHAWNCLGISFFIVNNGGDWYRKGNERGKVVKRRL